MSAGFLDGARPHAVPGRGRLHVITHIGLDVIGPVRPERGMLPEELHVRVGGREDLLEPRDRRPQARVEYGVGVGAFGQRERRR